MVRVDQIESGFILGVIVFRIDDQLCAHFSLFTSILLTIFVSVAEEGLDLICGVISLPSTLHYLFLFS